ncbi:hypothetical protein HPB47_004092 [Ixodes persulcatus]|uniref:Uncharacterized protein n=1 Tax=Ixodes persulcatus TaxID=34615 RepID=A0AC60PHM7_IXOPE|nr:hypothetical protein HPB47_004092 [Ixodes persulcatus]
MDGVHYHKLFTQKLPPAQLSGSVIMTDNDPYHSVKEEKVPRMSSLKQGIQAWLSKKGMTWSTDMIKAELMKLVKTVKVEGDTYRIDRIASEAGHTLIRLVRSDVKGFVASVNTTFKMKDLESLVWKGILQATAEKWKNFASPRDRAWTLGRHFGRPARRETNDSSSCGQWSANQHGGDKRRHVCGTSWTGATHKSGPCGSTGWSATGTGSARRCHTWPVDTGDQAEYAAAKAT